MLCKVCGAQIPDDATECEFCGAKTENFSGDKETEPKAAEETEVTEDTSFDNEPQEEEAEEIYDENEKKRREQVERMMQEKQKQLSEIEKRRNEKRKKQKRNRIILIALICVVALGAAGVGAFYISQNVNSGGSITPTASPRVTNPPITPLPTFSPAPSPETTVSPAPADAQAAQANTGSGQSQAWTATNGGSSSSKSSSGGSSSGGSSSGGSSSSSGSSSSRGTSGGGSASGGSSGGGSASISSARNSGIVSSGISSRLVTGGEVVNNDGTGKPLMTFVVDGVKYYANVSSGSTTDQVRNKPFTITAMPTNESFNGNTIYEITDMTKYGGDYILANSGTKALTQNDIKGLSRHDLALARNEIYARHGRKFQTEEYHKYFSAKSWYSVNPNYNYSDDDSNLNEIERKNVQFILNAERN